MKGGSLSFLAIFFCAVCICIIATQIHAQQTVLTCPPGQKLVDVSGILNSRGVKSPRGTMECSGQAAVIGGGCSISDPIQFLLQRTTGIPDYEIQRMGTSFSCNLAKFIDAGEKAGAVMRIYSGARVFRKPAAGADCQRVPCVPSTHELGCAADLTFNGVRQVEAPQCPGNSACVWAHANINGTGLQFRLMPQNGFRRPEPWHIELAGAQGPANLNSVGYCPDYPGTPTAGGLPMQAGPTSPSSGIAQALRNYLSPPAPPPTTASPVSAGAAIQACTNYYPVSTPSADPCAYYVPPTVSPSVSSTTSTNTTNPTNSTASSLLNALANPTPTTSVPTSNTINSSIPAIALITSIAYPSSTVATSTATGTPIALISGITSDVGLVADQPTATSTHVATATYQVAPTGSQTFTSQDLSQTGPIQSSGAQQNTFALRLLEGLRHALLKILALFKPFGGRTTNPNTTTAMLI